ncbi:MAG: type II secretion system protein [Candidatus Saccharibacteria bacterium]|nr:type II secretion system protein [Candidatus Saccharibacteria bacterium]
MAIDTIKKGTTKMKLPSIKKLRGEGGFTIIELLVVIAILAVLLAIVLVAINPGQHIEDSNNTKRQADVSAILSAVNQYSLQNDGAVPTGVTATAAPIGTDATATPAEIDICSDLVPEFIADIPRDPTVGSIDPASSATCTDATDYSTGYEISVENSRVTVASTEDSTITVTR